MKTLRKFGLLAVLAALFATPALAQDYYSWVAQQVFRGNNVGGYVSAISTHTALLVRYVGATANGGTVTVAAGGNLTFAQGPVGSSTADASVTCGAGGNGVIVVANAACDTLGEVVDVLNATTNWRAVILDGLRSESSNDTLAVLAETAANSIQGLGLLGDTAVSFDVVYAATPYRTIDAYLDGTNQLMVKSPYNGSAALMFKAITTSTYGSGTSTFEVFSCNERYRTNASTAGVETCTTIWTEANGATTVAKTFDFGGYGLRTKNDGKLVIRLNNSAANTVSTMPVYALHFNYVKPN